MWQDCCNIVRYNDCLYCSCGGPIWEKIQGCFLLPVRPCPKARERSRAETPNKPRRRNPGNANGCSWISRIFNCSYIYMRMNNANISKNQSKDLITLWCLHVKSKSLHSHLHAIAIILIIRQERACHVIHVHHGRMRTLVRAAIMCLHACIFWLKSAYATYVNMVMLAAIMSLIALFRSKYCVYMR